MGPSIGPSHVQPARAVCTLSTATSLRRPRIFPTIVVMPLRLMNRKVRGQRTIASCGRARRHDWQKEARAQFLKMKRKRRHEQAGRPSQESDAFDSVWSIHNGPPKGSTTHSSSSPGWEQNFWGKGYTTKQDLIDKEFARFKRIIDADPYRAVFGRRLQPFSFGENKLPSSLWQSLFGVDNPVKCPGKGSSKRQNETDNTTSHAKEAISEVTHNNTGHGVEYKFDPISCRMVPYEPSMPNKPNEIHTKASEVPAGSSRHHEKTADSIPNHQGGRKVSDPFLNTDQFLQPADSPTQNQHTQDLFTKYKSFIDSENTEGHQSLPSKSRAERTEDESKLGRSQSLEALSLSQDPESIKLSSLKPDDVRLSFRRRASLIDSSKETRALQHGKNEGQTTGDRVLENKSPNMHTYEDSHGPVSSEASDGSVWGSGSEASGPAAVGTRSLNAGRDNDASIPELEQKPLPNSKSTVKPITVDLENQIQGLVVKIEALNEEANALVEEMRETIMHNGSELNSLRGVAQESVASHDDAASVAPSLQYRILAYDPSTRQITEATVKSAVPTSFSASHPVDALSQIKYPIQFLKHFPRLESEGYELLLAGPEMLIFKKKYDASSSLDAQQALHSADKAAQLERESMEQVKSSQPKGRSATAAHDSPPRTASSQESTFTGRAPKAGSVFDPTSKGSPKEDDGTWGSVKRGARRAVLASIATGGTFYAIGVVAEYFRTGGQDGLGPRGFTGLEGR